MAIVRAFLDLLLVTALAASAQACSSDSSETTPPADGGSPPEGGAPGEECPAGELASADGSCRRAGIGADECGDGFEHDGEDACTPVLPAEPCPSGRMAIPGETACREVAPCGDGTWGDIPIDAETQHVDGAYVGGDSDGSAEKPWTTVQAGVDAAAAGAIVAIAAGSYVEHVLVQGTSVRLWGKCPEEVEIVGPPDSQFVIDIRNADGTEVHDLALTGDGFGLAVAGSEDVLGDRLWIHHTSMPGWSGQNFGGATASTVRRSLIEEATGVGGYALGASMTLEESVVRGTLPEADGLFGRGLSVAAEPASKTPSPLTVRRSVVEGSREGGIFVYGSELTLEDSVVRDTTANEIDSTGGTGVALWFQADAALRASGTIRRSVVSGAETVGISTEDAAIEIEATVVRDVAPQPSDGTLGLGVLLTDLIERSDGQSKVVMRRSVVERTHFMGVGAAGVDATLESVVIRDVESQQSNQSNGRGISIEHNAVVEPATKGTGAISGCRVERTREVGVTFIGGSGTVEATLVRDVAPRDVDGMMGRGISAEVEPTSNTPAAVAIDHVLVEGAHEFGIFVLGSEATIDRSVVRDTGTRAADGRGGVGIGVQIENDTRAPAEATIRRTTVEKSHQSGISVLGAHAEIEDVAIRATMPDEDGVYGDGITVSNVVWAQLDITNASANVRSALIEDSARAGLGNFGGTVTLGDSQLQCNLIHLDGELWGLQFSLEDRGGNQCGCDGAVVDCQVVSSDLAAPEPLD